MTRIYLCSIFCVVLGYALQVSENFIKFLYGSVENTSQITISLPQLGSCQHYAIGLAPIADSRFQVALAFLDGGTPEQPVIKSTIDGASSVRIQEGQVHIDSISCPQGGAVLVYLKAPSNMQVAVQAGGREITKTLVGEGVLIRDGIVANRPMQGFAALAMAFFGRTQYIPPQQLQDGSYLINPKILLEHVVQRTDLPLQSAPENGRREALLKVRINSAGQLVTIEKQSGDEALATVVSENLRKWRFRPLVIDGEARAVTCVLGFFVDSTGKIQMHGH
jgi:hypothetical protein